jgi:hypothetical protein
VYKGFKLMLLGLNVPVPPLQIPEEVGPVTKPEREVVGLFLQTDKSNPASTIGGGVKFI